MSFELIVKILMITIVYFLKYRRGLDVSVLLNDKNKSELNNEGLDMKNKDKEKKENSKKGMMLWFGITETFSLMLYLSLHLHLEIDLYLYPLLSEQIEIVRFKLDKGSSED